MDLVISSRYGRIGNRLFLHAHVLACAIENGVRVFNPCLDEYAQYFRLFSNDPLCRYPESQTKNFACAAARRKMFVFLLNKLTLHRSISCGPLQLISAEDYNFEFRLDDPEFTKKLCKSGYLILKGYFFRDYHALSKHQEQIVQQFDLITNLADNVDRLIDGARSQGNLLIGVHMRRGDYRKWEGGRYYYDDEQYTQVLTRLTNLFHTQNIKFMIASDEDVNLRNFSAFDCVKSTGHPVEDMYCLAGCDLITGPFSTYSSWASFYGNTPIYFIDDPNHPIAKEDFLSYAEFCKKHMQNSWQFPEV